MYDAKPRSQARILSQLLSQTVPQLLLALALVATGAWAARADNDGVYLTVKSGQPGELLADGKSRTILEAHLDPGAACWKQAIEAEGAFTLQVSTSLGTIEPTLATGTLSQFPMPLTLIAGTTSGTALVDVRAYYCPPGAVGAFGVCSDPQSQQNVCLANLSISIGDAAPAPAQPQPPAAPEEAPAFSASLSTVPPLPVEGGVVTCTVRVEGAREGESLAYTWYVDSDQAATTSTPTWTWDPALAGRHAIGVDVLGDARSLELSVEIDVQAKPAQEAPQAEGGAQAPAQPPQQPGVQPPVPAQPPQAGAGQGEDAAEPPGVRQPERPFKPSQGETGYPDPGEPGSPGAGAVEARGPVEELIEGEVARAPTAREAALAGALTGGAAIVKLALDLEAVRRARQVRDATPDLPGGRLPPVDQAALRQGVYAPGPDLPPAGGDAAARAAGGSQAADPWRRALDHTVESVPPELRNSEQWKQRIAPLLDQARQWDDPGRIQALDDRIRAIVDLRRQIDSNPAYRALPKHHQDALIWRRRGDDLLGAAREQDRQRLLSGPAQKPARPPAPGAPSPSAAPTQQKEVEFIDDLRTYPVRRVESPFRAQQRQQGDDPIARDLWRYRRVDPHKPGFESGWEKGKRWWRELKVLYEELRFGIPRPPAED